jgi:hypothetical protein
LGRRCALATAVRCTENVRDLVPRSCLKPCCGCRRASLTARHRPPGSNHDPCPPPGGIVRGTWNEAKSSKPSESKGWKASFGPRPPANHLVPQDPTRDQAIALRPVNPGVFISGFIGSARSRRSHWNRALGRLLPVLLRCERAAPNTIAWDANRVVRRGLLARGLLVICPPFGEARGVGASPGQVSNTLKRFRSVAVSPVNTRSRPYSRSFTRRGHLDTDDRSQRYFRRLASPAPGTTRLSGRRLNHLRAALRPRDRIPVPLGSRIGAP